VALAPIPETCTSLSALARLAIAATRPAASTCTERKVSLLLSMYRLTELTTAKASAAAVEGKTLLAKQGRGRPPRAGTSKSGGREAGARTPSLGERVLALATGKTRRELYAACPGDRPNHVGMAVQRHISAGRIQERGGKLYAMSTAAE